MVLPKSVFNYDAPIWVVLVHAAFVVLESIATCYIARSFFDNVIGLEKIVQARTTELDARTRDMRLVLDNVDQGFITIDRNGRMSNERSAIVETWLGSADSGTTFAAYLGRKAPLAGETFELGLQDVIDGFLPLEVTLAQLPQRFSHRIANVQHGVHADSRFRRVPEDSDCHHRHHGRRPSANGWSSSSAKWSRFSTA